MLDEDGDDASQRNSAIITEWKAAGLSTRDEPQLAATSLGLSIHKKYTAMTGSISPAKIQFDEQENGYHSRRQAKTNNEERLKLRKSASRKKWDKPEGIKGEGSRGSQSPLPSFL